MTESPIAAILPREAISDGFTGGGPCTVGLGVPITAACDVLSGDADGLVSIASFDGAAVDTTSTCGAPTAVTVASALSALAGSSGTSEKSSDMSPPARSAG